MFAILLVIQAMTVSSQVDSAVVYPYQVLVVRTASVTVTGSGELSFPGLPGALDDNTVRIKAPGLRVGEVQVKQGYMAEPTPEVKRLESRVRQLEDQAQGMDDEAAVLKSKVDFLNSIKLGAPELISKDLSQGKVAVESWRGALQFMGDELARVKARTLVLTRERADLQKQLDGARQEYQNARALVENRKEVRFDYDADAGTYQVQLSYAIPGAADWSPYYELRARPADGKVEVAYFAKLGQRTGEDWDRVKVVLSTMRPAEGSVAPEPSPWYLSFMENDQDRTGGRFKSAEERPAGVVTMTGGFDAEYGSEVPPQARAVETGISLQYVIPGRVSLASGEPAKKLALHSEMLPAEFEYYSLPRVSQQAYLTGKLVNSSDFVFLAGSGNTYVGDEYTGSTYVPTVAPQESTQLSFGVDERVKVKRELVKSFRSKGGLFSKTEKAQFTYKTTVENYLSKPVTIRVVEQVPVTQQGEIRVSVTKVEPKFLEEDKGQGTYTWKPTLENKGKFEVNIEFTVESPAGRDVSGLF
jgi:uncharacterized protein (TIGR02231 family)